MDRFTSAGMTTARFLAQRGLLKPLVWRLVTVTVRGTDALDGLDAPYIAVANHSSHLDAPLIMGALPRRLSRYLAAGAAADYFFDVRWRKWLTILFFNAFAIERNSEGKRSGSSRELLERGIPLLIFPEGGRTFRGEMAPFKQGAAALAIMSKVPCLPIAVVGANAAMPRGVNWPLPGRRPVAVVFGAPMFSEVGETADSFSRRLAAEIRRLHDTVQPLSALTQKEAR
ncbi:MAG: lysophospholipid acyltransferase family protein [Rhodoglobus sp.]